MPKKERSAGFLVFRDDPVAAGGRAFLVLNYGRHWDFAKGHLEKGEDDLTAAKRELFEETGIDQIAPIEGFAREIEYYFKSSRKGIVHKTVVFFLAKTSQVDVKLSEEHVGFDWLGYEPAMERLTFPAAQALLREASAFLAGKTGSSS